MATSASGLGPRSSSGWFRVGLGGDGRSSHPHRHQLQPDSSRLGGLRMDPRLDSPAATAGRGQGRRGLDPAEGQPLTCPPSCPTTWLRTYQAGTMVSMLLPASPAHQAHLAPQGMGETGRQEGGQVREIQSVGQGMTGTLPQWGGGTCWGLLSPVPRDLREKPSSIHTRGPSHTHFSHRATSGRQETSFVPGGCPGAASPVSVPEGPQHLLPHAPRSLSSVRGAQGTMP